VSVRRAIVLKVRFFAAVDIVRLDGVDR
jgi:hypothetical protein